MKVNQKVKFNVIIFIMKKPKVKLVGQDGNVFNLMGLCSSALKKAKQEENANNS